MLLIRNFVIITSFSFIILLSGCERLTPTAKICKNNPEICTDLHKDGWCRAQRTALVNDRLEVKNASTATGEQLYRLMLDTERYNNCVWLGSGVKHIEHPERSNDRARAYTMSSQALTALQQQTKNSKDPLLAFYHWSRLGDESALEILLTAEKQQQIHTPEILAALGGYYLKRDSSKALTLYLDAMKGASEETFNSDWLLGAGQAFMQLGLPEQNYLMSRANLLLSNNQANEEKLNALVSTKIRLKQLNEQAEELADALRNGAYSDSDWPRRLAAAAQTAINQTQHTDPVKS
ncbi:DUF2989 domain-containing protein [Shewanella sp. 4t3-1-2LB]|uniref:DUF2989 domain-containing protein n=1 Tax=Shewanella sp. 4t3-1-2LB TaxID=2817682 RepID=UPI001A98C9BD|nr:DUF2989 domain-containing protein [Shewanella sp. 4t3-1-2LB]MBO1270253.1 DUF2989 domain-containing protein [Shewanella sp. 4t3-1-2LB]